MIVGTSVPPTPTQQAPDIHSSVSWLLEPMGTALLCMATWLGHPRWADRAPSDDDRLIVRPLDPIGFTSIRRKQRRLLTKGLPPRSERLCAMRCSQCSFPRRYRPLILMREATATNESLLKTYRPTRSPPRRYPARMRDRPSDHSTGRLRSQVRALSPLSLESSNEHLHDRVRRGLGHSNLPAHLQSGLPARVPNDGPLQASKSAAERLAHTQPSLRGAVGGQGGRGAGAEREVRLRVL